MVIPHDRWFICAICANLPSAYAGTDPTHVQDLREGVLVLAPICRPCHGTGRLGWALSRSILFTVGFSPPETNSCYRTHDSMSRVTVCNSTGPGAYGGDGGCPVCRTFLGRIPEYPSGPPDSVPYTRPSGWKTSGWKTESGWERAVRVTERCSVSATVGLSEVKRRSRSDVRRSVDS